MTWAENWSTHHFVSLDGEDYRCNDCDSSSGSERCPGQPRRWGSENAKTDAEESVNVVDGTPAA